MGVGAVELDARPSARREARSIEEPGRYFLRDSTLIARAAARRRGTTTAASTRRRGDLCYAQLDRACRVRSAPRLVEDPRLDAEAIREAAEHILVRLRKDRQVSAATVGPDTGRTLRTEGEAPQGRIAGARYLISSRSARFFCSANHTVPSGRASGVGWRSDNDLASSLILTTARRVSRTRMAQP